ncbi:MAG: sigma-70 family RNA polymerase sigma factor, partial [Schleiferiaceae bacterium]|nr:sigma-70 family RNA polymerase sigma factor [Schleiferiaceae bacterium]
ALYDYCFSPMMAVCLRYFKERSEAVAVLNDAFLKVLLHLKEYDAAKPFLTWVLTITVHTAIDQLRKNKRLYVENASENEVDTSCSVDVFAEETNGEYLLKIIHQLPENEKIVFNLFELEGYSHKEIATQLDVSERTSKRLLAAAKNRLKHWILNVEFMLL